MPKTTSLPASAAAMPVSMVCQNCCSVEISWSEGTTRTRASPKRSSVCRQATATAAAVLRPTGSKIAPPPLRSIAAMSVRTRSACFSEAIRKIGVSPSVRAASRRSVLTSIEPSPERSWNCLGLSSRDNGHSRDPTPPLITKLTIRSAMSAGPFKMSGCRRRLRDCGEAPRRPPRTSPAAARTTPGFRRRRRARACWRTPAPGPRFRLPRPPSPR